MNSGSMLRTAGVISRRVFCCSTVPLVFGMSALASCSESLPDIHFRLTVIVETPQGRRSGSSVIKLQSHYGSAFPGPEARGIRTLLRGEAVSIQLSGGGYLFALLKWQKSDAALPMLTSSFADLLPARYQGADSEAGYQGWVAQIRALSAVRASRPVVPEYYPVLAYFDDLKNPRAIHAIAAGPGTPLREGVRLVGANLEITDAPLTESILKVLPWLSTRGLGYLDPDVNTKVTTQFPEYRMITADNFMMGGRL